MSDREVAGSSRGSGTNICGAGRIRVRGRRSKGQSVRAELPVSSSGRVLMSNPRVLDWLSRSSTSSQMTSDYPSQQSVGSSDTTISWHGPGTGQRPSPVLNPPLSHSGPSTREVVCGLGSAPLYSEEEQIEDSQQLLGSQERGQTSPASCSRRQSSDVESGRGGFLASGQRLHTKTVQEDSSDDQTVIDDDVADRNWEPGEARAPSSSSGEECVTLRIRQRRSQQVCSGASSQEGGSSAVSGAKRPRGRPPASQVQQGSGTGARPGSGDTTHPVQSVGGKISYSAVWQFFAKTPEEPNMGICRMCGQKVKRGQGANIGTTALRQHMQRHHPAAWEKRVVVDPATTAAAASSGTHAIAASQGSTTSAEGSCLSVPSSAGPDAPAPRHSWRQQSFTEAIAKRQQYASNHPKVQKLTVLLSKLLVLQSLPFRVVDSAPFRELMACAEPRWRVPSRNYFSKKAVPALHKYVEQKVGQSLSLSVCTKVHGSADVWSCNYGQGQYMSFTAHWVNVLPAQPHQQLGQETPLSPPRCQADAARAPMSAASSSSTTITSASTSAAPSYHMCRAQRCHAVLHLACLGERSHTGEELLRVMQQEIKVWLSPRKLQIGTMVTDNGSNMVSALHRGGMVHAPCMAHVFNLVVKRFLKSSTDLQDILKMGRKLCMHFIHSYKARNTLLELQRQNGLPQHTLICDVSTRWNSSLHMLDRLYEQRKAINDFLMIQADKSTPLCNFDVSQWQLMRDTCRLLRPFEEATFFVSRQDYGMNNVIPLLHVLEQMLKNLSGQGTGDVATTSRGRMSLVGTELEDEEEEDIGAQALSGEMSGFSTQVTGEEEQEHPEEVDGDEEDEADDPQAPWQYTVEMEAGNPSESLAQMARSMLICLSTDSRIVTIRHRDDFWLSTLLDPRYRSKMGAFFPAAEREDKLKFYREILRSQLAAAYVQHGPSSDRSDRGVPQRSRSTATAGVGRWGGRSSSSSISSNLSLESLMSSFLHPPIEEGTHQQQQDLEQTLNQQVVAYLDSPLPPQLEDPLDYWAAKLYVWPQLAEFAVEKLSCPASSVASERVFSAAGAIVTPRRTRLSTLNVERLTFVKMNQGWIGQDFHTPMP